MKQSKKLNNGKGVAKIDFINSMYALDIVKLTNAHIQYVTFYLFKNQIQNPHKVICTNTKRHLTNLCLLFGLHQLYLDSISCFECGYFSGTTISHSILQAIKQLNSRIRPHAISIIESLEIPDNALLSAIGNSYGDIYEKHLELAKGSRLNTTKGGDSIPDGYMEYIMPVLKDAKM